MEKEKMEKRKISSFLAVVIVFLMLGVFTNVIFVRGQPYGPDDADIISNETREYVPGKEINISGGYIATMNLTVTAQNRRWKSFVGSVTGKYTLDDAAGSTIYDWATTVTEGRIYATMNSSSPNWEGIECANETILELENINMNHTNPEDNISATFNNQSHDIFWVGGIQISANTCPSLNTYVDGEAQSNYFEEMVLHDNEGNIIYASILEDSIQGYDGEDYDFQMIVPEMGSPGFSGSTAYYLYLELG